MNLLSNPSFRLLLNLRWLALVGLGVMFAIAEYFLALELLQLPILVVALILAGSNTLLELQGTHGAEISAKIAGAVILLDILLLTAVLAASGGSTNPFSIFYLVHIALAAVLLDVRWTWAASLSSIVLYGLMFLLPDQQPDHHMHSHHDGFSLHLQGMWFAFSLAAILLAMFLGRILQAVKSRDEELNKAKVRLLQNEQFASLVTLSAGAAHELSTPLATISLVSEEIERVLATTKGDAELRQDLRVLRSEVSRCRHILDEMRGQANIAEAEESLRISVDDFIADLATNFSEEENSRLSYSSSAMSLLSIPKFGLKRVVIGLIKNSLESDASQVKVLLYPSPQDESILLCDITDNGAGMAADVVLRCTEPFFTTKAAGKGMGLGLFLARVFCERHSGGLVIDSEVGLGTKVSLWIHQKAQPQKVAHA